jgi:hypothetical protein
MKSPSCIDSDLTIQNVNTDFINLPDFEQIKRNYRVIYEFDAQTYSRDHLID